MDSQYQSGMGTQEAAAKAQYADQCNNAEGYSPKAETLAQQIGRRLNRESDNLSNLYRAKEILLRHPEFEEMLWLIRSGLV